MAATSKFILKAHQILYLLIINVSALATLNVNFTYNSISGWSNIQLGGDASIKNGILMLTNATAAGICSWATYPESISLTDAATGELASFVTHFSFIINATNASETNSGDGLAFFLSPYPHVQPAYSCGGDLGLFTSNNNMDSWQNQVVALEFDTYSNEWDPRYYHVGVDVNNIYSVVIHELNDIIKNGTLATAWVNYSAAAQTLDVFLNYGSNYSESPGDLILSYPINLTHILPSTVAVGFSAATGNYYEVHQVLSWEFSSTFGSNTSQQSPTVKAKSVHTVLIAVSCAIGVILFFGGFGWFLVWRKKSLKKRSNRNPELPRKYSYHELVIATSNFAPENKLGEGGFGPVFKGYLRDRSQEVAVKHLKHGSKQGLKEFESEVKIMSKLRHPNLVELFGWCAENGQLLLVYKYMPNGSLKSQLYDMHRLLLWHKRYEIILNLAVALCYLQTNDEYKKDVVHRDIKPDNVLLDSCLDAKLSDFGLARLVDHNLSVKTTDVAGSWGYLAPELSNSNGKSKPSTQSDIYSFGVVLLEIACGRKPADLPDLVGFVWECFGRNKILEAADERLRGDYNAQEMERVMIVGLWCAHTVPSERPTILVAKKALNYEDCELPILPRSKPDFIPFK